MRERDRARRAAPFGLVMGGGLAAAAALAASGPAPGRYEATLCTQVSSQPRHCGPARVDLRAGGAWRVLIADFTYQLVLDAAGEPLVVLSHGPIPVDAFPARPAWAGHRLSFEDDEKRVRYEVQVQAPVRP